jgi:hypothetical protein
MTKNDAVRRSRLGAVGLAVALAVILPACGSDDEGEEIFTDTETLSVLEPFGLVFTAQRNGTVDTEVDWNSSNNDIDIYATAGTCANFDVLLAGGCSIIALSESGSAKPERFTFDVSDGTVYTVWALNLGPGTDTVTIRLTAR